MSHLSSNLRENHENGSTPYLYLAVDVRTGQLYWQLHQNMKRESVAQAVHAWHSAGVDAIVWDGAPGHRAQELQKLGPTLINEPPYAPELNPVERFFQLLRQQVEGEVYATLQDKQNAVEHLLLSLARTPAIVRSLTGYPWIRTSLDWTFDKGKSAQGRLSKGRDVKGGRRSRNQAT